MKTAKRKTSTYYLPCVTANDTYNRPTRNVVEFGDLCLSSKEADDAATLMAAKMPKRKWADDGRGGSAGPGYSTWVMVVEKPSNTLI